jgi:hypothetical protein
MAYSVQSDFILFTVLMYAGPFTSSSFPAEAVSGLTPGSPEDSNVIIYKNERK